MFTVEVDTLQKRGERRITLFGVGILDGVNDLAFTLHLWGEWEGVQLGYRHWCHQWDKQFAQMGGTVVHHWGDYGKE